ncbi:AsmA family protein [Pseudohaliea rubra]|uniref:Uncharacterized protein n=1 Tax=Pseudohaliea rubra DSM 19751 TaxID=1265313 RepID=A0A095WYD6_9GAMM|nr:AsmA-like C-terminal region-containing protein [Pseudohaliea rubra]KGE03624.1 hypothetical protein HRUBRA_02003 [Pseudohaliea rubra DSM 19751]
MRKLLVAFLLLAGIPLAGLVITFSSDRATFAVTGYLVQTFTPYRLVLEAPVWDRGAGRLSAAGVRLYQQGLDGPPLLAVQKLEVQRLGALLRRGDLRETALAAASVQTYVDATDNTEDPEPADWLRQTRWLPGTLDVGVVHAIKRGTDVRIVPLRNSRGRWTRTGQFTLDSTAQLPEKLLELALTLEAPARESIALQATITTPADESVVSLDGSLTASAGELTYQLALEGDYRRVETLLASLDNDAYGFAGRLRLRGELSGNLDAAKLAVQQLTLNNSPAYDFSASGSLRWHREEPVTVDLSARGTMASLGPFAALLGTDLSALGEVDATLALDGSLRRPRVRRFAFTSQSDSGLTLTIEPGEAELYLDERLPTDLALRLRASGPAAGALAPWLTLPPLETGPWVLTGTVQRSENAITASDLDLTVQALAGGTAHARGSVDYIAMGEDGPRFRGLALRVNARGLAIESLLAAKGVALPFPAEGILSLTGTLRGDEGALALGDLDANLQAFGGTTRASGRVESLGALEGVDLRLVPVNLDPASLGDALAPALQQIVAGGRAAGSLHLRRGTGDWGLDNINLTLEGAERIDLAITGSIQHLTGVPRAQLEASYRVRRPADDTGIGLPPGEGTAVLDLQSTRQLIGLHAFLGETDLTSVITVERDHTGITGLRAELNAPRLHLPDLARLQRQQQLVADEPGESGSRETGGSPFTRLPAYPLELRLDIGEVSGRNTSLSDFSIIVRGADRRFTLGNFDVEYAGGAIHLRGVADFSGAEAAISLAGDALGVPVTALAADLGYAGEIEGTLSLRGGLTTRTASLENLVANLDGTVAGAVADGYVEGAAFDLLMTDLVSWLLLGGVLQSNTNFECGMAQFLFRDGVARSEDIYLATRHMIAQGKATLDFTQKELDVRIDPRARSRTVQIPSSVRIRGAMNDPSIIPSPISATFDASARLLFMTPELGMRLFGIKPEKTDAAAPCAGLLLQPDERPQ